MLDFIRIACAVPAVKVGDVKKNAEDICGYIEKADLQKADVVLFPELALTGYTCGDLFFQDTLHNAVKEGLCKIVQCTQAHPQITAVVGLPMRIGGKLYNCAAVITGGEVRGVVPKLHIPGNERRWFSAGDTLQEVCLERSELGLTEKDGYWTCVDAKQLFCIGGTQVGIEVCEDLMTPTPPSAQLAVDGAEVILNLAASDELVGKRTYRRDLVKHQSAACNCVYAFCSAGHTESTSDMVFSGHSLIAENGTILTENDCPIAAD